MTLMKTLLAAALAATLPLGAVAQDFPDDTVTVVIPFTPGGSNDTIGRYLAENLAKHWDSTVVVENKQGAGQAIGSAYVANRSEESRVGKEGVRPCRYRWVPYP